MTTERSVTRSAAVPLTITMNFASRGRLFRVELTAKTGLSRHVAGWK